jgi:outer membrane immunogenic protein
MGETTHTYDRNDNHGSASNELSGAALAITLGYNWRLSTTMLAGIEADLGAMDLTGDDRVIFDGHVWKAQFGPLWTTLRGRLGVTFGNLLVYGTAGLALMSVDETGYGDAAGQTAWNRSVRSGWVAGIGGEYAFSPRWSAKLEYLHMDYGTYKGLSENQEAYSFENRVDLVRIGLNYRF